MTERESGDRPGPSAIDRSSERLRPGRVDNDRKRELNDTACRNIRIHNTKQKVREA